jgi:hypothetical protein
LLPSPRNLNACRYPGPDLAFPAAWREEVDNSGGRIFALCGGSTARNEGGAATHEEARRLWRSGPARSTPPHRRLDEGS